MGGKALRLAYWNAEWVCGKKPELDQFLSQHGVDICLLNETYLDSGRAFRFAIYICHRTDRQARDGDTANLFEGILIIMQCQSRVCLPGGHRHTPSVGKQASEKCGGLTPTRPLIESDLNECLSGGLPVLMAGDLNAKHTEWNSRLITTRGALLRD
jgi:hypothetical protein